MNRFFAAKDQFIDNTIRVTDLSDIRHLTKSLRLSLDDPLLITDGDGGLYLTRIFRVGPKEVVLKITERRLTVDRSTRKIRVTLACAIPKNVAFEEIVDKAVQLGADEIIPLLTQRGQVSISQAQRKRARWERVRIAALKQSGALFAPCLREPFEFRDLLKEAARFDLCLLPNLEVQHACLKDSFHEFNRGKILVVIGPEGDFSKSETEASLEHGFKAVSLGASVLRVDTAAAAVLSFIRIFFCDEFQ